MALKLVFGMFILAPLLTKLSAAMDTTPQHRLVEASSDFSTGSTGGGGVRCYCNDASCVATGYLCRARAEGGCYSELGARADVRDAKHGCLHHLSQKQDEALERCQNKPTNGPGSGAPPQVRAEAGGRALLLCCFRDLCNHVDSPSSRLNLNSTYHSEWVSSAAAGGAGTSSGGGEAWFRAATIAVPVCGALILFLLVAVAVRMLRTDTLDVSATKLGPSYIPPSPHQTSIDMKNILAGCGSHSPLLVSPPTGHPHLHPLHQIPQHTQHFSHSPLLKATQHDDLHSQYDSRHDIHKQRDTQHHDMYTQHDNINSREVNMVPIHGNLSLTQSPSPKITLRRTNSLTDSKICVDAHEKCDIDR